MKFLSTVFMIITIAVIIKLYIDFFIFIKNWLHKLANKKNEKKEKDEDAETTA